MGDGITATVASTSELLGGNAIEVALPKEGVPPALLNDPVFGLLTWVVALVALIISIGKPIKDYLQDVDNVKAVRELSELVGKLRKIDKNQHNRHYYTRVL